MPDASTVPPTIPSPPFLPPHLNLLDPAAYARGTSSPFSALMRARRILPPARLRPRGSRGSARSGGCSSISLDRSIDRYLSLSLSLRREARRLRQRPATEQPAREPRPLRRPEVPLPLSLSLSLPVPSSLAPAGGPVREIPTVFKAAFIRAEKRD